MPSSTGKQARTMAAVLTRQAGLCKSIPLKVA
jgi:hypothetical protein